MDSSNRRHENPGARQGEQTGTCRRQFLRTAGALAAAGALAGQAKAEVAAAGQARADERRLPQIRLGKHSISRLICGANPFNAGSHLSVFVNRGDAGATTRPSRSSRRSAAARRWESTAGSRGTGTSTSTGGWSTRVARCTSWPSRPEAGT